MSYAPAEAERAGGHRAALLAVGVVGAALFALVQSGVVQAPDLEGALTELSDTLGAWKTLVAGGLQIEMVSSDHLQILREPQVQAVAAHQGGDLSE